MSTFETEFSLVNILYTCIRYVRICLHIIHVHDNHVGPQHMTLKLVALTFTHTLSRLNSRRDRRIIIHPFHLYPLHEFGTSDSADMYTYTTSESTLFHTPLYMFNIHTHTHRNKCINAEQVCNFTLAKQILNNMVIGDALPVCMRCRQKPSNDEHVHMRTCS